MRGEHAKYPRPGDVHQTGGAHPELAGLLTQPQRQIAVECASILFDTAAIGRHIMYAERQGRFFDITEHFTEKRRVAGVVVAQVHLCHVVAVR
ncbi:hypothetical protein A259_38796, partial [Pseudomonas syringae pv. actinidiae ICMP 19070]